MVATIICVHGVDIHHDTTKLLSCIQRNLMFNAAKKHATRIIDWQNINLKCQMLSNMRISLPVRAFATRIRLRFAHFTKISEVNLSAFIYRLFHEDRSSIIRTYTAGCSQPSTCLACSCANSCTVDSLMFMSIFNNARFRNVLCSMVIYKHSIL